MRSGCKFAVLALIAVLFSTAAASAQFNGFSTTHFGGATIHGVPPSVTSFGFGGTPGFHGVAPSVTSLNFGNVPFHASRFGGFASGPRRFRHHRHDRGFINPYSYGYVGGYYIPYAYDQEPDYDVMSPGVDDSMEENYRGGPTIFDRRGPGTREYPRPQDDYRAELNSPPSTQPTMPPQSVSDQPSTVLIFKDGHQLEIHNYAIVGTTLYDLSDGRTLKFELAQLDLPATVKQNDDRGVGFQLPAGMKLN